MPSLPGSVEITGKLHLLDNLPIFGMSQNPSPPCWLFALLFALFVFEKNPMEIQILGIMDRKKIPSVSQQAVLLVPPHRRLPVLRPRDLVKQ